MTASGALAAHPLLASAITFKMTAVGEKCSGRFRGGHLVNLPFRNGLLHQASR
jgi:hypothetical protein